MEYLELPMNERSFLLKSMRDFNIQYNYVEAKIKRIDGLSFFRKVASISLDQVEKLLQEAKEAPEVRKNGTCKKFQKMEKYKMILKVYKKMKDKNEIKTTSM